MVLPRATRARLAGPTMGPYACTCLFERPWSPLRRRCRSLRAPATQRRLPTSDLPPPPIRGRRRAPSRSRGSRPSARATGRGFGFWGASASRPGTSRPAFASTGTTQRAIPGPAGRTYRRTARSTTSPWPSSTGASTFSAASMGSSARTLPSLRSRAPTSSTAARGAPWRTRRSRGAPPRRRPSPARST